MQSRKGATKPDPSAKRPAAEAHPNILTFFFLLLSLCRFLTGDADLEDKGLDESDSDSWRLLLLVCLFQLCLFAGDRERPEPLLRLLCE